MLPSLSDPQHEGVGREWIGKTQAYETFHSAISGRPYRVTDKTRARFVLFRAEPDTALLRVVLRLIPRHPEHADAFFYYVGQFPYRRPIERLCLDLVAKSPYPYVRGEAWHVLARYNRRSASMTAAGRGALTERAVGVATDESGENFFEKWGACHFLCVSEEMGAIGQSRCLERQAPLLQALTAPALPDVAFQEGHLVESFLKHSTPEPGLSVCSELHERALAPSALGVAETDLSSQAANTLRELGVISSPGSIVDPIAETLDARYGVPSTKSWRRLLRAEYSHALGMLRKADAIFDSGRTSWLMHQNSFNQIVFLALQRHLAATQHPAACRTIGRDGQLVDFGSTLDAKGPFSRTCPNIGDCFRAMNARRNNLPVAHPYDKKTATRSRFLERHERDRMVGHLRTAYVDFVAMMP